MGSFQKRIMIPLCNPLLLNSGNNREEEKILFSNLTANTMDSTTAVYKQILSSS